MKPETDQATGGNADAPIARHRAKAGLRRRRGLAGEQPSRTYSKR